MDVKKDLEQIERIMAQPFDERLTAWLARCQEVVDRYYGTDDMKHVLSVMKGKRYARIVIGQLHNGQQIHKSAWAFVDMTNGDVLKPASWKKPAEHARGNIDDEQGGVGQLTALGPCYLKGGIGAVVKQMETTPCPENDEPTNN